MVGMKCPYRLYLQNPAIVKFWYQKGSDFIRYLRNHFATYLIIMRALCVPEKNS